MRYDLGVWIGPRPRDNKDASDRFARLSESFSGDEVSLPSAELAAFAHSLLHRWPDLDVWATAEGLRVQAQTDSDRVDHLVTELVALARMRGMICYDAQRETVIT